MRISSGDDSPICFRIQLLLASTGDTCSVSQRQLSDEFLHFPSEALRLSSSPRCQASWPVFVLSCWWSCLTCRAEVASLRTVTVLRLPRGTLLGMRAVLWYCSQRHHRYLRAHPCGLDNELFPPLCLCSGDGFFRCLGSAWARIVVLMVLVHLLRRDGNPRTHLTVFRAPRGTLLVMISPMVQLPPAPSVLACTSVWSGLRTISSLSRWTAVPAAAIVSPMCPEPTNCSAWRWQFIDKAFLRGARVGGSLLPGDLAPQFDTCDAMWHGQTSHIISTMSAPPPPTTPSSLPPPLSLLSLPPLLSSSCGKSLPTKSLHLI